MTSEQKRAYWSGHFEAWKQSDLTKTKYCEQHSLKPATFSYWRTRLRKKPAAGKLIPVNLGNSRALIGIALPNGIRLEVPVSVLTDTLSIVCRALQEVLSQFECCGNISAHLGTTNGYNFFQRQAFSP